MKLSNIGSLAALVIIATFLLMGADKIGVLKLRGAVPAPATTEAAKK